MTLYDDFMKLNETLKGLPEPISYIVLDHGCPPSSYIDDHDSQGRRYMLFSPAVLDELRYEPKDDLNLSLTSIPLYWRNSMPEGWPDS